MFAVAPTDGTWFERLREEGYHDTINFWTPTPWNIRRLRPGDKFFFLLKAPIRKIGGFAHFSQYENLTTKEAWDKYGPGNGVSNLAELVDRAQKYAKKNSSIFIREPNPTIGCIVLKTPVFLEDSQFYAPEERGYSFPDQVVKVKYFDGFDPQPYYEIVSTKPFSLVAESDTTYSTTKAKRRDGQPRFRQDLLASYEHKCAITGETCLEVLQASHIQPYVNEESNHVQNGLLLRIDLHTLFDVGLITITPDYRVKISPFLKSTEYVKLEGTTIRPPKNPKDLPTRDVLEFHNKFVFRG